MGQPFRIVSSLPPKAFRSFMISRPRAPRLDFWRKATCEEYDCEHWRDGWRTSIDISTDLGKEQARYIERGSRREFTKQQVGSLVVYTFTAGQMCFRAADHKVPNMRPSLFLHRIGDHRPAGEVRRHANGRDWVEDMQTDLDRVRNSKKQG